MTNSLRQEGWLFWYEIMMTELLIITLWLLFVLEMYPHFMEAFEYGFLNFPIMLSTYLSDERSFWGLRKNQILGLRDIIEFDPIFDIWLLITFKPRPFPFSCVWPKGGYSNHTSPCPHAGACTWAPKLNIRTPSQSCFFVHSNHFLCAFSYLFPFLANFNTNNQTIQRWEH